MKETSLRPQLRNIYLNGMMLRSGNKLCVPAMRLQHLLEGEVIVRRQPRRLRQDKPRPCEPFPKRPMLYDDIPLEIFYQILELTLRNFFDNVEWKRELASVSRRWTGIIILSTPAYWIRIAIPPLLEVSILIAHPKRSREAFWTSRSLCTLVRQHFVRPSVEPFPLCTDGVVSVPIWGERANSCRSSLTTSIPYISLLSAMFVSMPTKRILTFWITMFITRISFSRNGRLPWNAWRYTPSDSVHLTTSPHTQRSPISPYSTTEFLDPPRSPHHLHLKSQRTSSYTSTMPCPRLYLSAIPDVHHFSVLQHAEAVRSDRRPTARPFHFLGIW